MHIGFRTSGGRGEYELVGGHAGQSAAGLEEWTLSFRWPDGIVRDTQLWLDPGESGKLRLRSLASQKFQVGRLVAAILMLPPPIRDMRAAASSLPVLQARKYIITKIGFGPETEFASPPETVTAVPNYVEVTNAAHSSFFSVSSRWDRISRVCNSPTPFPPSIASVLDKYRSYIDSGLTIDARLAQIVNELGQSLSEHDDADSSELDPLLVLERLAEITPADAPALPPPDELSDDEADIKVRSAHIYRLTKARDFKAYRFSAQVQEAYGYRCAFCGMRLGNVPGVTSGIDAAHILAWSSYDLDVVANGLALCKNHHWAFDVALMVPFIHNGAHTVRFTRLKEKFDPSTLAQLGIDGFVIPDDWLPREASRRPSEKYLTRLYDDLAINF